MVVDSRFIGGVPHALTEDDFYKGHFLPKGL